MTYEIPSDEYEVACFEAVRDTLAKVDKTDDLVSLVDVELVRDGDDRRIVATVARHGRRDTLEWRLYEDYFTGKPPAGEAEDPDGVAMQMYVWAIGG